MRSSSIVEDARLGERAVGQDAHLAAGVALRLEPHLLQRDREQADRHLLAGGGDDVELARIRVRRRAPWRAPSRRLVSPAIADTTTTS